VDLERTALDRWFEIDADGTHVAQDLLRRLFECEVQAALTALTRGLDKLRGNARLAAAGGPRHENAAAAVVAAAEHIVES
jgi:hypothetical protein